MVTAEGFETLRLGRQDSPATRWTFGIFFDLPLFGFKRMLSRNMEGLKAPKVTTSDMTFWMVQSHELKFWKTGHAIFSGIVGLSHVKRLPDGFSGDARDLVAQWYPLPSFLGSEASF